MHLASIRTRFDQQVNAHTQGVEHIMYTDLIQVPEVGETVNLKGNPFIVIRRGWAMPEDDEDGDLYTQYCYITVLPATAGMGTPIDRLQDKDRDMEGDDDKESDEAFLERLARRPSWARDRTRLLRIIDKVQHSERIESAP